MADISKITLPTGDTYNIKDAEARAQIAALSNGTLIVSFTHTGSGTDPYTGLAYELYSGTATRDEVKAAAAAGKVVIGVDDSGKVYHWAGDYTSQNVFVAFFCGAKNTPDQITRYMLSWSNANNAWQQFARTDSFDGGGSATITTFKYNITSANSTKTGSSIISGKTLKDDIAPVVNNSLFKITIDTFQPKYNAIEADYVDIRKTLTMQYLCYSSNKLRHIRVEHSYSDGTPWAGGYKETLKWTYTDLVTLS